nr:E3 ubiquitin-protein ligase COP1-like isoform X2 [Ipomoea batatas]
MQILLEFLHMLKKKKVDELNEIQNDLQYIKEDVNAVERHRIELYRTRDRYSMKLRMLADDPLGSKSRSSSVDRNAIGLFPSSRSAHGGLASGNLMYKKMDGSQRKDVSVTELNSQHMSQSGLAVVRKKRVHAQFNDLQECYLQKRRQLANQLQNKEERDQNVTRREGYTAGLSEFQSVLSTFTRYSRLRVIAELRHGDIFHSANIVSSIEFDRDDELFATAGVSRRIKVFDFSSVSCEFGALFLAYVRWSFLFLNLLESSLGETYAAS